MNGYCVFYCGSMDDVPVYLTSSRDVARKIGRLLRQHYGSDELSGLRAATHHHVVTAALEAMGRDCGTFVNIVVATFCFGKLSGWDIITGDATPPERRRRSASRSSAA